MTSAKPISFLTKLAAAMSRLHGTTIVVAVSGGADSVAMLRGLSLLRDELKLSLHAAHLNHQLRGLESAGDADWVRSLCQSLNVPCDVESRDVADLAKQRHVGIEEAAREARYQFLSEVAERRAADVVVVAHTADDQAETILHHILRGTGLSGLRGMERSRELSPLSTVSGTSKRLIRPMLSIWRAEVESFLAELNQEVRQDATNCDVTLTRNRLRHDVLPTLARDVNPRVREHLCRLAEQAADAEEAIRHGAQQLFSASVLDQSIDSVRLRVAAFDNQPRAFVREAFVRLWASQNWSRQFMTFEHWQALANMTQPDGPVSANLPENIIARRRGQLIAIERQH